MRVDPNGNSWWDNIKNFFKNTFGAGIVQVQKYEEASVDNFIVGSETGVSSTKVISGDISKPI